MVKAKKPLAKCVHGKHKQYCRECSSTSFCVHGKWKYTCGKCNVSYLCDHGKRKNLCRQCNGSSFCKHDKRKSLCRSCGGSAYCLHGKQKGVCKTCKGVSICVHGKHKRNCSICDPKQYLVGIQRHSLWRIFNSSSTLKKTKSSVKYLGCEPSYFKDFIQSKMTSGMTLDTIHLDHIKPVTAFNLDDEEEFNSCCHYTNFQPLSATENLQKSSKWSDVDEAFWKENIRGKEYIQLYIPTSCVPDNKDA